ncbi:TolB family protein, partial [Kineococcus sp. SYSU DK005]|uniref:TolB family protein n=1 Tax=Kineococcus sp. SYSU DK005 TaxID=3383126 RepID=UPI003D7C7220
LATRTWELISAPGTGTTGSTGTAAGTLLERDYRVSTTAPSVAVSADGQQVFFFSARTDLVPGDTNRAIDLFRKDLRTGVTTRISTDSTGAQLSAGAVGSALAITPDARFAVFVAKYQDIRVLWRKDLSTGELAVVSGTGTWRSLSQAHPVSVDAHDVAISDDGRYVAFSARSTALTPRSIEYLAYRRDMSSAQILRVGVPTQVNTWEHQVALDPSGRYVFFQTAANVGADVDGRTDWYRRDTAAGPTAPLVLVTSQASGAPSAHRITTADAWGSLQVLSGERVVVATLQALVPVDTNARVDLYRKDLGTGAVTPALG